MSLAWSLGAAAVAGAGSLGAAALLVATPRRAREALVGNLVAYATGALLGAALLGVLPEALEQAPAPHVLATVLGGILAFFALERVLLWRHCHAGGECDAHRAAGVLILVGDGLHNFVDGVVIAGAFLVSVPLGIGTALAVIAHEIPQELGDVGILLDSGFRPPQALAWNAASSVAALPGAVLGYVGLGLVTPAIPYVLALAAASFLYIGLADLVPSLHRRLGGASGFRHVGLVLLGVATIAALELVRH